MNCCFTELTLTRSDKRFANQADTSDAGEYKHSIRWQSTEISGFMFSRGTRNNKNMYLSKSSEILSATCREKRQQNNWRSSAYKVNKRGLVRLALKQLYRNRRKKRHGASSMHCCETYRRGRALAYWEELYSTCSE